MRRYTCATAGVTYMLCVAAIMQAQTVQGAIGVTGGSATDVAGITSRAFTVTPSLSLSPNPHAVFALSGNATRFANQQWSAGVDAAVSLRAPLSSHAFATLNASGSGVATSYDFSYRTAGLLPALELTAGPVTAYGGARVAGATMMSTAQQTALPRGPFSGPTIVPSLQSVSRSALGALAGANVCMLSGAEALVFGARLEQAHVDSVAQLDRMVTLSSVTGRLSLNGAFGVRNEPGSQKTFGSVGGSLAVAPMASLEVNVGAYPADRLIGTPAGHYLSIGAALRVGRLSSQPVGRARAEGAPPVPSGVSRLTLSADDAARVDVVGDFTNWQPIAAHRAPNGVWYVDLRIPPGQYRYAFRVNGTAWRVPAGVEVVDDDFGGKAAWLVVSTPDSNAR